MLKIEGLIRGLTITKREGYSKVIIEGDSQLIIKMSLSLLNGNPTQIISKKSHLEGRISCLTHLLEQLDVVTTNHVPRKGNKLDDYLDNAWIHQKKEG